MRNKGLICTIILLLVFSITIGFSAFGSKLSIGKMVADVRVKADIRVTDVSLVTESSLDYFANDLNYNVKSILPNITFNSINSYITYKVTVTNIESAEMGIFQITGLPEGVSYELTDYTLQDKLCDSTGKCNLGISKDFYIKIYPTSESGVGSHDLNVKFDFRQFYTVSYLNDENTMELGQVISGGKFTFDFSSFDEVPKKIFCYINGLRVSDTLYSYSGNILTYDSLTGNVTIKSANTLQEVMKLSSNGVDTNIKFSEISSLTNGNGVNTLSGTETNDYPIYYYRGDVSDNNVKFANFCWKMVRTTETGGIKFIYNGVPAADGSCNNTGTASQIGTSVFNSNNISPASEGYMYGTSYDRNSVIVEDITVGMVFANNAVYEDGVYKLSDTYTLENGWETDYATIGTKYHYTCFSTETSCEDVYYIYFTGYANSSFYMTLTGGKQPAVILDEMLTNSTNETSSTIKEAIDSWYSANMTAYTSKLEDTAWCNDRSIYTLNGWDKDKDATGYLRFGVYGRNGINYSPSLECLNTNDKFTVDTINGNGKLTYPVGLLTLDEIVLAGAKINANNTSFYLYTGEKWWTVSPYHFVNCAAVAYVDSSYSLNIACSNTSIGVRPSVSLKKDTLIYGGDGSVTTPYVIE